MFHRIRRGFSCAVVGATIMAAGLLTTQAPANSLQYLPEETVAAVRVSSISNTLTMLRERTRLGAELLSDERINALVEMAKEMGDDADFDEMIKELAKVGLKPDDIKLLGKGDVVFSMILENRPNRLPLMVGMSWVEPGEEHAVRFFQAIGQGVEKMLEEDKDAIRRVDRTIAGARVMHLSIPEVRKHVPADFWEVPPQVWEMPEAQINEFFRERQAAYDAIEEAEVDRVNLMIAVHGGKLVFVNTFPQNADDVAKMRAAAGGQAIDFDDVTGANRAAAILAQFLQSHGRPVTGGFMARMNAVPGLTQAMPRGDRLYEAYINMPPLMRLAHEQLAKEDENAGRIFQATGLTSLGPIAFGASLDRNIVRQGALISLPAQRTGLLTLLEQRELPPAAPAWVPADVESYGHVSFDLGRAYDTIKRMVIDASPEAEMMFGMAEGGMQGQFGLTPSELLGSMGHAHHFLSWGTRIKKGELEMFESPVDTLLAIIWRPTNEPTVRKLFDGLKAMSEQFGGEGPQMVEEQGFTGMRIEEMGQNIGFFLGRGFLTMAMGEGITEKTLALLRRGEAANSLAAGPLTTRARQLLNLRPGMAYFISDMNKSMVDLREMIMAEVGQSNAMMLPDLTDGDEEHMAEMREWVERERKEAAERAEKLGKLLPTAEQLRGIFGVSVGQIYLTREGLIYEDASELAPKQ